ncbi:hypothetical protein FB451DRAFT_1553585 [Mycena latifolia]|nr:hypothetical protein FB451DRAFT_1553585 [Mycena latifolia]
MPPYRPPSSDSESELDADAPEAVSLTQAKHTARTQEAAREQLATEERKKRKARNRERDQRMKARAGERRGEAAREDGDEVDGVESRMERAMREAEEESGEESGSGSASGEGEGDVQMDGVDEEEDSSDDDDDDDDEEEEEMGGSNPHHLPEHLFASAFASGSVATPSSSKSKLQAPASKKRKRATRTKDRVVGSRTIRIAPSSTSIPTTPATLPSRKIRKFTDRALALKGTPRKTWTRLPDPGAGASHQSTPTSNPTDAQPLPAPSPTPRVKITPWRFLNTVLVLGLGIYKATASYLRQSMAPTTLDWIIGVVWALICYWVGFVEQDNTSWFFAYDLTGVLLVAFLAFGSPSSSHSSPSVVGEAVDGRR